MNKRIFIKSRMRVLFYTLLLTLLLNGILTASSTTKGFQTIGSTGRIRYQSMQPEEPLQPSTYTFVSVASNNPVAPSVPFKIDGSSFHENGTQYLDGEWSWYTVAVGKHTLEMSDPWFNPSNGIEYHFSSWSDGVTDNPRTINVEEGQSYSYYAVYSTSTTPPMPPPSGAVATFAQFSDTHFGWGDWGGGDSSVTLVENAIRLVKDTTHHSYDVDFVIVTGDIVRSGGDETAFKQARETLDKLEQEWYGAPVKYYAVTGNHDGWSHYQTYFLEKQTTPTLDYIIDFENVRLVVQGQSYGSPWNNRYTVTDAQKSFMEQQLSTEKLCIFVCHWLVGVDSGFSVSNDAEIRGIISSHTNCKLVICGHIHTEMFNNLGNFYQFSSPPTGGAYGDSLGSVSFISIYEKQIVIDVWHTYFDYSPSHVSTYVVEWN